MYLVGQLPRCYAGKPGFRSSRVIMYVPKALKPDHILVRLLGWRDAKRLVEAFGGEILQPANCSEIYRQFRDKSIVRMARDGMRPGDIASLVGVSERHVRNLLRENPQQDGTGDRDNTATEFTTRMQQ